MIRVLHLDDDRDDFALFEIGLKKLREDLEITWAGSVAEALKTLDAYEFDCIVSDFHMPERDGLEMLMELRQSGMDIPFIFLTGQGDEELAARVFREGANDYYTKSNGFAHYERILNSITRHVEAYRHRVNEHALKQSEEKYRRLFESAFDGIFLLGNEGEIIDSNRRVAEILGYDSPDQIIGHSLYEFSTAYQRGSMFTNEAARKYKEIVETGEPQIFEWTAIRRDGATVDLEVTLSRIDTPGSARYLAVFRDISERKRNEREMVEAYQLVVGGPVIFFRTSAEAGFPLEYASPNISQFGFDDKDVASGELTITRLIHPDDVPALIEQISRQTESEADHFETEFRLLGKQGRINWVYEYAIPVKDHKGNITNFLGYAVDITQRKVSEEIVSIQRDMSVALSSAESMEEALEVILDAGCRMSMFDGGGIYLVDSDTGSLNLKTSKNLPQNFIDAVGFFEADSIVTRTVKDGLPVFFATNTDEHPVVELMKVGGLKSATIIPIFCEGAAVASLNLGSYQWEEIPEYVQHSLVTIGNIIGDEIARIRAQEELRKTLAEVKARSRDLELLNKELESFSYAVSHDLRSPLRHISGFSEILTHRLSETDDPEVNLYLEKLTTSARQMSGMIEALFQLSSTVKGGLKLEDGDLSAIASETADALRATEGQREVAFEIQAGIKRRCDLRLARVVLDNLLGNAWKFSAGRERAEIEFGETGINGSQYLFVRDNGIGFDDKHVDKLFIPFSRLHDNKDVEGTGLGLATVQRIVHRHGGRIWAESSPDKGATFFFHFGN